MHHLYSCAIQLFILHNNEYDGSVNEEENMQCGEKKMSERKTKEKKGEEEEGNEKRHHVRKEKDGRKVQ